MSMISFLTNEKLPARLQTAIEQQKRHQNSNRRFKKDRRLFLLGSCFIFVFLSLIILFVYTLAVYFK